MHCFCLKALPDRLSDFPAAGITYSQSCDSRFYNDKWLWCNSTSWQIHCTLITDNLNEKDCWWKTPYKNKTGVLLDNRVICFPQMRICVCLPELVVDWSISAVCLPVLALLPLTCCWSNCTGRNLLLLQGTETRAQWAAVLGINVTASICAFILFSVTSADCVFVFLFCWLRLRLGQSVSECAMAGSDSFSHTHT